jgi:hypothetical protein
MAFAGTPENHGYNCEPSAGFAKIVSHKVRHTKRRVLQGARRKALEEENAENAQRRTSNIECRERLRSVDAPHSFDIGRSALGVGRFLPLLSE